MVSNLLSHRVCILRYTVLIGIPVSTVISIADFGLYIISYKMVLQYLSETISINAFF